MRAALASLLSLVAALSCCLPLGTLAMAAGSAGASILSEKLRPWLLLISVASLVLAFAQTYFVRRCQFRQRRARTILLWFSIVTVSCMLFFPRVTGTLLAGRFPGFQAAGSLRDFDEHRFIREFNAAATEKRVVLLLSPT